MEFQELLEQYENNIQYANRMMTPESLSFFKKTIDYWNGFKHANFKWFQTMKDYSNFKPFTREPKKKEKEELRYTNMNGDIFEPCAILEYRNEIVPIYNDDYGQQEFILYKDNIISGGTYNLMADYDFCHEIDRIKDGITF